MKLEERIYQIYRFEAINVSIYNNLDINFINNLEQTSKNICSSGDTTGLDAFAIHN